MKEKHGPNRRRARSRRRRCAAPFLRAFRIVEMESWRASASTAVRRPPILLELQPLARALAGHQLPGKALACQALECALVLDDERQAAGELGAQLLRGLHLAPRPGDHGTLFGKAVLVGVRTRMA